MKKFIFAILTCLFLLTNSLQSEAGQSCEDAQITPQKLMQGFELAHKLKVQLDNSNAKVAIIARAGQDLSQYQLRYSHLGIARKDATGRWLVMHELNQCGTATSNLFDEGLANFFMDDPFRYEALVLIPNASLQEKILQNLNSSIAKNLHEPKYNMLAFAFSTQYQNSNQWALEVLASAMSNDKIITQRNEAQAWLKLMAFQASTIELSTMTRLGARLFKANISFDDHPFNRRMAGKIDTVTVESVARFMQKNDAQLTQIAINLP